MFESHGEGENDHIHFPPTLRKRAYSRFRLTAPIRLRARKLAITFTNQLDQEGGEAPSLQYHDSQGAGEPAESTKHGRIGFRIELSESADNQIGAICLPPVCSTCSWSLLSPFFLMASFSRSRLWLDSAPKDLIAKSLERAVRHGPAESAEDSLRHL